MIQCGEKKEIHFLKDSHRLGRHRRRIITGVEFEQFVGKTISWNDMLNLFKLETFDHPDDPDDPSSEFTFTLRDASGLKDKPSDTNIFSKASEFGFDEMQNSLNTVYVCLSEHIHTLLKHGPPKKADSSHDRQKDLICSYEWLKTEDELEKLHERLCSNNLIKEIEYKDFKVVFSKKPTSEIETKIHWEEGQKLFAYFFSKLIYLRFIPQKPTWIHLKHLFTYYSPTEGKIMPISSNFRTNVNKIKNEGNPKKHELIDAIFEQIESSALSDGPSV